ncbi:MAG: septum formation inhibitor Maf [Clostridia bacterium]|nr:septum formation inhibitor Maf [Clostridia bacterium]
MCEAKSLPVILASKSPRRAELLERMGVQFVICPADVDETVDPSLSPAEAVIQISERKARALCTQAEPGQIVVACDTVVALDGKIFGKPADRADATEMLMLLSGREHEVFSGLTVCTREHYETICERTAVKFRSLDAREIEAYLETGEPFDKAGAYGIQGVGALLITGIDGDYYNVMGLPVCRLLELLRKFGMELFGM